MVIKLNLSEFNGGEVGLAITQIMAIAGLVQWGMRQSAEVANQMMSVERILEYTQIQPEANLRDTYVRKDKKKQLKATALVEPPKNWPEEGTVEFKSVYVRYTPKSEPVLRSLSFLVKPTEKVHIDCILLLRIVY